MPLKILYLYSELVGYQTPIFEEYTGRYGAQVYVVSWDRNKLKPYTPPQLPNVTYYARSQYNKKSLKLLVEEIKPDIAYISGWMDNGYLWVAKYLRSKDVPVVTGFDDQWKGTIKQVLASSVFPLIKDRFFSHAWVAGPYQYEFARRLGFKKNSIIFNLLSCNTKLFQRGIKYLNSKSKDFPTSFLYVGNFRTVKGTDILAKAFDIYQQRYKGIWKLIVVGNGNMKNVFSGLSNVEVYDFMRQDELVLLTKSCGVFVLPSRIEQWGVVVHEFASAGLPLIVSENVGSKPIFLIENYNGISFHKNSPDNLAKAMNIMSSLSPKKLIQMGKNSFLISNKINPEISAASFLSIVDRNLTLKS